MDGRILISSMVNYGLGELCNMSEAIQSKKPAKKKWKRAVRKIILFIFILILLAGIGYYAYCKLKDEYTITYTGYQATVGTISNSLSFSGSMQLVDNVTYTAESDTKVRSVFVAEGDTVLKGQKLMRLADGKTIEADFDGRVNKISVEKDDEVTMGTALVQVADFSHLRVSVRIDEYDINDVAVGDQCLVTTTATEKQYTSSIHSIDYISASAGNVAYYTGTVNVEVNEADGVYPGMQVTVTIPQEEAKDVVVLKMDALSFDRDNAAFVWVYDENEQLVQKPVTVGVSNGNYVEIKEGVSEGDTVYAEVKEDASSANLFSSLFGGTRMMNPGNSGRDRGNFDGGSMPGGNFGGGSMPSGSFGGGASRGTGSMGGFPGGGGTK